MCALCSEFVWMIVRARLSLVDKNIGTSARFYAYITEKLHTKNAMTCWSLAPELSSADWVFQLLLRPSGTLFRHTCARHWLVADSLEMG